MCLAGASRQPAQADQTGDDLTEPPTYSIGLSQTSFRRKIRCGELDPLDFPAFAMDTFGISQIDIFDDAMPPVEHRLSFLEKMRARSEQAGTNIFMMIDPVRLGSKDLQGRTDVVKRFHQLVDQARFVGAKYLKVYLDVGDRTSNLQATRAVDGLKRLADYAATNAAKSYANNEEGLELQSDYPRLFQMIVDADFRGIVAIQYEGQQSEVEGVKATQKLLQRLQESFSV